MLTDVCDEYFCGDLLGPPPIPPEELLPWSDCRDIITSCHVLSSLKDSWSNYSDSCLPAKVSTASSTVGGELATTATVSEELISTVTQKYPHIVTTVLSDSTTTSRLVLNITKTPQTLLHAAIPAWLIGVIVVAVLAFIIVIVLIVICIIKSAKGERCLYSVRKVFSVQFLSEKRLCLQRSQLSKWISSHSKWRWWSRRENPASKSSPFLEKERPETLNVILEPQSPSSLSPSTPLTNGELLDISSVHLDISANSFSEEVFKELNNSELKNDLNGANSQNYVKFTKEPHFKDGVNKKDNLNMTNHNSNDKEVIVIVTNGEHLHYNNLSSDDKSKPCNVIGQSSKRFTRDDIVLTYNEKNQENLDQLVTSDDLVLGDKDSINSLKVDSGYTSRQVSNDNCAC